MSNSELNSFHLKCTTNTFLINLVNRTFRELVHYIMSRCWLHLYSVDLHSDFILTACRFPQFLFPKQYYLLMPLLFQMYLPLSLGSQLDSSDEDTTKRTFAKHALLYVTLRPPTPIAFIWMLHNRDSSLNLITFTACKQG